MENDFKIKEGHEYIVKMGDKINFDGSFPIESVTELVRCKDCINCVKEPNGELYCDILAVGYEPLGSKKVTDDFYCADGKRKDDDSDASD